MNKKRKMEIDKILKESERNFNKNTVKKINLDDFLKIQNLKREQIKLCIK